jgi:signal transduction histidine kinase
MVDKVIRDYKDNILSLRGGGKLDEALGFCEEAIGAFPSEYFFYKIKGDILVQKCEYKEASDVYIQFLLIIPDLKLSFSDFAGRYNRLKKIISRDERKLFATKILNLILTDKVSNYLKDMCQDLIKDDIETLEYLSEDAKILVNALEDKSLSGHLFQMFKTMESKDVSELERLLDRFVLDDAREISNYSFARHCISFYEKRDNFSSALKLAEKLLSIRFDSIVARTYLRICRKLNDFDKTGVFLTRHPLILKSNDFNVLYELVYFYEWQKDVEQVDNTLRLIEKHGTRSIAIQKTVKNFYLRFGYLEDADRVDKYITSMYSQTEANPKNTKNQDAVEESQAFIWSTIKDLSTKLEHEQQITAIADLTRGISHELGQPITNIRYTVQFYSKMFKEQLKKTEVLEVFASILEETERMGGLIRRLSPITSSRNTIENIDIVERIKKRVVAETARTKKHRISVVVSPNTSMCLILDPIKFDQIITNLLLNAIDAIVSKCKGKRDHSKKQIFITLADDGQFVKMFFTDTGTGIPVENSKKIFEPFFTTKPTGKGEGLGLFIVWNLIKALGGGITLDTKYRHGTRFAIILPKLA